MARMTRGKTTSAATLVLAGALLMTGCSSAESAADEPTATAASKTPRPTHIPTPTPTAKVQPSDGAIYSEVVLGSLENQTGSGSLENIATAAPRLKIVTSCVGTGDLRVEVPGAAAFSFPCETAGIDGSVANAFPVTQVAQPFRVLVTANNDQTWGMTVLEEPAIGNTGP
ncbi:hypothetical protein QNO00_02545 [Arthrobacter sp. zg-Y1219]|uniref:hypothetical protein n=1 Tax=Arthrobacter sp. zg-Y1219 TaxID=3049067 RepID=UPI0024C2B296|nr:hypothetical protein [Arthrobacter sp. zg-Y1219]MDK1359153.1 hypothetical protein [Arthrobacter sp. zg-Y1219]